MGHDCCGQKRSLILFFSIIQQMQRLNLEYYVFGIKNNKCFKKKRNHQKRTEKIRKKQRYYYIKKKEEGKGVLFFIPFQSCRMRVGRRQPLEDHS